MLDANSIPVLPDELLDIERVFAPEWIYIGLGCAALATFEYCLTFTLELRAIWSRRFTIPSILFLLNRYLLQFFAIGIGLLVCVSWRSDTICEVVGSSLYASVLLMTLVHAAFIAMRVHAINNHRWPWTILLIVLGTMSFPFNLVTAIKLKEISLTGGGPSLDGCWGVGSEPIRTPAWQRAAIAETVIGGYIMNTLVIAITWYRTAGLVLAARRANIRASFGYYLLRDGTTYFLASLIYNTVFIIVQETQNAQLGVVSITIQSIMMSRFILNLRTLDTSQTLPRISDNGSKMSEPRFRSSAFDNMGAQLDVEEVNDREYERMHLGVDEDDDEVGRLGTVHEPGVLGGYRAISKGDTAWDAED